MSLEINDRLEMGLYEPAVSGSNAGFLRRGVTIERASVDWEKCRAEMTGCTGDIVLDKQ